MESKQAKLKRLYAYKNQPQSYEALKREFPFLDVIIKRQEVRNE